MFRTEGRDVPVKLGEFIHSTDRQLRERLNHLFLSYCVGSNESSGGYRLAEIAVGGGYSTYQLILD